MVKVDTPEDRIKRIFNLTLKNCPLGVLFEKAGVKTSYKLRTPKD